MDFNNIEFRVLRMNNERDVAALENFLARFGLAFERPLEYTLGVYMDETLVGTGSMDGEVLRNIAVLPELQGRGVMASLVSRLIQEQGRRGRYHSFIFTRPEKVPLFVGLGFREIVRAEPYAALLEWGIGSVEEYCKSVEQQIKGLPAGRRAGVVVNCNPFTFGHSRLIRCAAEGSDAVIVFVVSEDRSLFPFADRIRLVREGLSDLTKVAVVAGGRYMISAATFPGYFTRGEETLFAQTRLDATLFASRIAPLLGITARYVGEEPYCPVTAAYNQALREILPQHGIALRIIPRLAVQGEIVSAATVREMIRQDQWQAIRRFVPETTFRYLLSKEAEPIIARIKQSQSRH